MSILDAPARSVSLGFLKTGNYYFTASPNTSGSTTLGTGNLRLTPWPVPNTVTLTRIGAEVIAAGDAGCKFRLGIYADDGSGYPGALVLDAGTIAGDAATAQEIVISQALSPGLYWVGGASQIITTTGPTMRTVNTALAMPTLRLGATMPSAAAVSFGFTQPSVTGALPANYTSTVTVTTAAPRVFVKV